MTTDALRRLQALRGLTRVGSTHTVLAQVQGDLQTAIEAVLELAGHDDEHEHPTDEPAVGEQVTDSTGIVWQRFEDGWRWWVVGKTDWSPYHHTWDDVQNYGPLRPTTDDDRRRVGLPVRAENTPSASQDGPLAARSADPGKGGPPEPENAAQGRIGWLRMEAGDEHRYLMREVPGGWTDSDRDEYLACRANTWTNAEFTPIPTLAADEVAVQREDLPAAIAALGAVAWGWPVADAEAARRIADRLRRALEAGEGRG